MKLVQKTFLRGSREFEIEDDVIQIRIRTAFKVEKSTVLLSMLNPEPVMNADFLEFHNRVRPETVISLLRNKPNVREFDTFVNELTKCAREAFHAFAGLKNESIAEGLAVNSFEEPPEFGESNKIGNQKNRNPVRVESIVSSIRMLKQHLDIEEIKPLLSALEALKERPEDESGFTQLVNTFDDLGSNQGAVLNYAPYISVLLSDDCFGHS